MAVGPDDVRRIAHLARVGVSDARIPSLVAELNGILAHMDALQQVRTEDVQAVSGIDAAGMPLRVDGSAQIPLARAREDMAPAMRDGFFLVPRLHTHGELGASADESSA